MSSVRFLFHKGIIEILLFLSEVKKAKHSDIYKQGFVSSRESFSSALKALQKAKLAKRKVIETRPPRTEYSLTPSGQKLAELVLQIKLLIEKSQSE